MLFSLVICNTVQATENDTLVSFKERLGLRTNVLNWGLMTPNIGFEYDIVQNKTKKISVGLSAKYNWNSTLENNPRYVYNILGVKANTLWYFRTRKINDWEEDLRNNAQGFMNKYYAYSQTLTARRNPRTYRAYYVGPYLSYDKYTLKLGETGYQGSAIGFGASFGFNTPLYLYSNGTALDFEVGADVGFVCTNYDKFKFASEDKHYVYDGTKDTHFVPFPVISEVRIGFVYRFKSIREQIPSYDDKKLKQLQDAFEQRQTYEEANIKFFVWADSTSGDYINPDSVDAWNSIVKKKNEEIRRINKLYGEADSTELLTELSEVYKPLKIPNKLLSTAYKKQLKNRAISSAKDLDMPFLNDILKSYAGIKDEVGITSVETEIKKRYKLIRDGIFNNTGDSVEPIPYMKFLTALVPEINARSIVPHNNRYIGTAVASTANKINLRRKIIIEETENNKTRRFSVTHPFLNRDTLYAKSYGVSENDGQNYRIEAENTVKRIALEKKYSKREVVATTVEEPQKIKPEKSKKKRKDKKNRENKTVLETMPQFSDTLMQVPDTLMLNSNTLMLNTLSDSTITTDVPSDSTIILQ